MNLSDGIEPCVSQIAFSSDGRHAVFVFDNIIGLLEISDGSNVQTFGKSDSLYVGVSFCNDDKYIATISEEGIIMIWDVHSGNSVMTLKGHTGTITAVKYSPNGKHIVSAGIDGSIIIWDFTPLQELIDRTHDRFEGKPLTHEEREKYYLE